jgi:hypothetical protein
MRWERAFDGMNDLGGPRGTSLPRDGQRRRVRMRVRRGTGRLGVSVGRAKRSALNLSENSSVVPVACRWIASFRRAHVARARALAAEMG